MPIKSEIKRGFKCVLRTYTLSQHFVSTLGRLRFVSALRPYALSKAKDEAAVLCIKPVLGDYVLSVRSRRGDGCRQT